jgi:hypothetical protein
MMQITLKLTAKELELLSSLASDQLFRREFIDSRLPGSRSNPADLSLGKQLIERFRVITERAKGLPSAPRKNGAPVLKGPRATAAERAPHGL